MVAIAAPRSRHERPSGWRAGWQARRLIITALDQGTFRLEPGLVKAPSSGRIRCPHCLWQPERGSRWLCYPAGAPEFFFDGCGTSWNTFDTRGVCPGCSHQWRFTSCLSCAKWAPHQDWYAPADDGGPPLT